MAPRSQSLWVRSAFGTLFGLEEEYSESFFKLLLGGSFWHVWPDSWRAVAHTHTHVTQMSFALPFYLNEGNRRYVLCFVQMRDPVTHQFPSRSSPPEITSGPSRWRSSITACSPTPWSSTSSFNHILLIYIFFHLWQVTHIECGAVNRAVEGCLQYHTSVSGTIR